MSGNQTSNTTQQSTTIANPAMQAAVSPILNMVPGIATTAYNPAMNVNVAGLNAQQQAAISGLGGLQSDNPAQQYLNQANQYSQQAADPNSVLRMQQQFYNPMASAVQAQLGNIFGQQNAQLVGNAAASGAIGGSRYGVAAGNLANQQGLAAGQTLSGLQQQALNAAQTEQGQISQQAFTQGQLGQQALNTQIQAINAALQGGNITQQQAQALYNAATQNAIQSTLFPQQEAASAANIAGIGTTLGGTTYGQGQTTQPVNYLGQVLGAGITGYGLYASDERVKENIEPIGKSFDKQTIYKFNYIGDPSPRIGLMAQEVQKKHPSAVKKGPDGIKAVDYNKATAKSAEIGEQRQHRSMGGGTTMNGMDGIAGFSGLNSGGLQPYFAQMPQVNVPQTHFPTLNLNPQQQGPSQAQQQADQNAKQMMALGTDLSKGHLGSDIADLFATPQFGARGGRIHRQDGGLLSPEDEKNLDYLRGGAPSWLGGDTGNTPPPSAQPIGPSTLERFLNERRSAALHASPLDYDAQTRSAPPQPLLQNASLAPGSAPEKLASVNPAEPPALTDAPTIVKSETYRPDGTQIQPAGFTPTQMGAAPPSVAQPKPAPNQQPQWGTPEWHNWADGYGRVSIQGETGRTSAFQGLKEINTHDTNGSHSYGNYGLNSGGSAQEFVRQYGLESIGLTAQPGTPMFDWQWREAASNPVTADVLRKAEIDYYNNHYVNPTVTGMSQYLPVNIANNRAAQEYMIDKSVQQGTGTWDGNSGIGVKHIRRAQQAAEESGGDPVKFVNRMAQLDHAAVGSDFPAALHSGAYSPLGDLNRLRTRVSGALGELGEGIQALPGQIGEGIRGVFGGGTKPQSVLDRADLQPPPKEDTNLRQVMRSFGYNLDQPQGLGGSLGRALGTNPSMDPQTANRLVGLGLGMMAAGPSVGIPGLAGALSGTLTAFGKGGQYALNQEQQERAQAINLANAAVRQKLEQAQTERALKPEWQTVRKELVPTLDPMTKMYVWKEREVKGWVNPFTQEIVESPQPPVAPVQTPGSTPSVPGAASQPHSALNPVTFTQADGSEAPVPAAIAEKFNPDDQIDQLSLRILSGQAHMPKSQREDPRYMALKRRVYELDPTYNENRSTFYSQFGGANGKTQLSFDAFGTALKHAHTLDDANWNKHLTDTGWAPLNAIPQAVQRAKGQSKLKNYEDTSTAYADEHYRTLVPSGSGTMKEREKAESNVAASIPRTGRLSGNAANVDVLLGKMLKLDDKYNRNMGIAASINKPQMLNADDREIIRDIFSHEPDPDLKMERYRRYSKDPRTADLVSPPTKAATKETPAAAQPQQAERATTPPRPANVPEGAGYSAKTGKWYDPVTHQPIE